MMPRLFWEPWEATGSQAATTHLPSADAGIVFTVTAEMTGTHSKRLTERQATDLALAAVVERAGPVAKHYTLACADTCATIANAACADLRKPHRHVRLDSVTLAFTAGDEQRREAEHLALLRRTAAAAGPEAVQAAASAHALAQVVLDSHAATVAHLLDTRPPEHQGRLSDLAAELRRGIDDHEPDRRWIRVAEAITSLHERHEPGGISRMVNDLAAWAKLHDQPTAEALQEAGSINDGPEPDPAPDSTDPPHDPVPPPPDRPQISDAKGERDSHT